MPQPRLSIAVERFPVAGAFTIARGSRTEAVVVTTTLDDGRHQGRGECVPYARYGETVESVIAAIRSADGVADRQALAQLLPAGAARNALDCAFWDIEAKRSGKPAMAEAPVPFPAEGLITCYTLSLGPPEAMAAKAREAHDKPLLKLKLGGGPEDALRMRAVRAARPDARLVADANEAWAPADLAPLLAVAAEAGMEVIEQPLPAGADGGLAAGPRPVPICADESVHTAADLARLAGSYDGVNIKLDKAGGLTAALAMVEEARRLGLDVMVGCMLSTSLAMAPAQLIAGAARWLDLDGPLLLAADRTPPVPYRDGRMLRAPRALWG